MVEAGQELQWAVKERESVCMLGEESEKERQRRDRGGPQRGYGFQKTHE